MPFIDARISEKLDDSQKDALKAAFGQAIGAFGKGEGWLMVQIQDDCDLWRGGSKLSPGAFVATSMVGPSSGAACADFSARVAGILSDQLGIPGDEVYLTVTSVDGSHWGWNGSTF